MFVCLFVCWFVGLFVEAFYSPWFGMDPVQLTRICLLGAFDVVGVSDAFGVFDVFDVEVRVDFCFTRVLC